jgi:hypothetical protein
MYVNATDPMTSQTFPAARQREERQGRGGTDGFLDEQSLVQREGENAPDRDDERRQELLHPAPPRRESCISSW